MAASDQAEFLDHQPVGDRYLKLDNEETDKEA